MWGILVHFVVFCMLTGRCRVSGTQKTLRPRMLMPISNEHWQMLLIRISWWIRIGALWECLPSRISVLLQAIGQTTVLLVCQDFQRSVLSSLTPPKGSICHRPSSPNNVDTDVFNRMQETARLHRWIERHMDIRMRLKWNTRRNSKPFLWSHRRSLQLNSPASSLNPMSNIFIEIYTRQYVLVGIIGSKHMRRTNDCRSWQLTDRHTFALFHIQFPEKAIKDRHGLWEIIQMERSHTDERTKNNSQRRVNNMLIRLQDGACDGFLCHC